MASAATIVSGRSNTSPVITFHTLSGALVVQCNGGSIEMKLPRNEPVDVDAAQDAEVIALVCGDLPVKTARLCSNTKKLLLQLEDATPRDALEALRPDTVAMSRAHDGSRYRGVIVTTTGNGKPGSYDFISRYVCATQSNRRLRNIYRAHKRKYGRVFCGKNSAPFILGTLLRGTALPRIL